MPWLTPLFSVWQEVNVCAGFMADGREVFKVVDFGLMTKVGVESTNRCA